jgi:hypothetical protein
MSTKLSQMRRQLIEEQKHHSVLHMLEDAVLQLEQAGESEQEIHSMVAMILRGFIVDGQLTPEYIQLANQAMEYREQVAQAEAQRFGSSVTGSIKS